MNTKLIVPISLIVILCGCVPVLIGAGILTGYSLSNDSASGNLNVDYRDLWDTCMEKMEELGSQVSSSNESKGIIKGIMGDARIAMKINSVDATTQRLKVSARKHFLPHPKLAQDIFFKIVKEFE